MEIRNKELTIHAQSTIYLLPPTTILLGSVWAIYHFAKTSWSHILLSPDLEHFHDHTPSSLSNVTQSLLNLSKQSSDSEKTEKYIILSLYSFAWKFACTTRGVILSRHARLIFRHRCFVFSEISFTLTKWLKCSSCNSTISADVAFVAAFKWQHSIAGFCRFDFIINDRQSLLLHNWICFCLWLQTWIGARRPDFWLATRKMPLFLSTQTVGRYCCRLICFLLWNLRAPRVLNSFWQTLQLKVWNTPSASSSISIKAMQDKLQKLWQDIYSSCQNTIWH